MFPTICKDSGGGWDQVRKPSRDSGQLGLDTVTTSCYGPPPAEGAAAKDMAVPAQ